MNRKQVALKVVLLMTSAFLGGLLSNHLFLTQPASAAKARPPRSIIAREFRLIDNEDRTRALLQLEMDDLEVTLTLFSLDERPKIKFIVDREGNASAHFWERKAYGKEIPKLEIYPSINFWNSDNYRMRHSLPYK